MSRLIDKLNRVSQAVPQPMGFRVAQPISSKSKLLLIASLTRVSVSGLADCGAGADGGLLPVHQSLEAETFQKVSQAVPGIPWGVWLRDSGQAEIKQIVEAGCDFVVFPAAKTSLAILQNDAVGKILEVEASLSDGLLRAIDELPVDAVLIATELGEGYFLTWHHLMLVQHFANLLAKPLLVCIASNATDNELQALWGAGVDGVIVEVEAERVSKLRKAIDKLTFSPRKRRKAEALLPYIGQETSTVTEEEEE
jgi:hypothetical protein